MSVMKYWGRPRHRAPARQRFMREARRSGQASRITEAPGFRGVASGAATTGFRVPSQQAGTRQFGAASVQPSSRSGLSEHQRGEPVAAEQARVIMVDHTIRKPRASRAQVVNQVAASAPAAGLRSRATAVLSRVEAARVAGPKRQILRRHDPGIANRPSAGTSGVAAARRAGGTVSSCANQSSRADGYRPSGATSYSARSRAAARSRPRQRALAPKRRNGRRIMPRIHG